MKILLLNPSFKTNVGGGCEQYYVRSGSRWPHSGVKLKGMLPHYLPFPFFLSFAAAFLKRANFDVFVLDCVALDMGLNQLVEKIEHVKPDIVFWEPLEASFDQDTALANDVSQKGAVVVWGGAFASVMTDECLLKTQVAYCLKGEYESTLLKLAEFLRDGSKKVPAGVRFRTSGQIEFSGAAEIDKNFDCWPDPCVDCFPSSELPDITRYWDGFCQHRPAVQMLSSRGCRYACSFCVWNQVLYRRCGFRSFSVERIIAQMEMLVDKFNAREIYFDDDDFACDPERVISFCRQLRDSGLKVTWSCMVSVASLNAELAEVMVKSGCIGIKIGIESICPDVLKALGKPVDADHVCSIIKVFRSFGVKVHATFVTGLPEESLDGFEKTLDFIRQLDVDSIQVSAATAFAGTVFYDKIQKSFSDCKNVFADGKSSGSLPLAGRKRHLLLRSWLLSRVFSPLWVWRQTKHLFLLFRFCGIKFVVSQFTGILIDEIGSSFGAKKDNSRNA